MAVSFTRRLLVVAAAGLAVLGVTVPASTASPSAKATPSAAGYCPNGNGVTVIVDFQELGGGTQIRCAPGEQATGVAALQNAGFTIQGTQRWGLSFICRIQGKPGTDTEPCVNTPPASAYWGYWHAPNGGSWTYSQQGAAARKPPLGSFEGWSFSKNKTATTNPPPGVAPVRPAAAAATGTPRSASTPVRLASSSAPEKNEYAADGVSAGRWLANEVNDGRLAGPGGPDFPDWGLTIDALLMLRASGADAATANEITEALATEKGKSFYTYADSGKTATISGAAAKTLVAAVTSGKDPTSFGGADLPAIVTGLMNTKQGSADYGRISDRNTSQDNSNTFGQSFAVLGLSDHGTAPQPMVDFLIKQQCPSGGFRLSAAFGTNPDSPTCTESSDVLDPDSTGMAVQALLAAADDDAAGANAAAAKAVSWLVDNQRANGSFGGSGPTEASNTNSTGLAAQALAAAGETTAANEAASWIRTQQLTAQNGGKAKADSGAIAYNPEAFAAAVDGGIEDFGRDQWRRATAQAGLAFTDVRLGQSGSDAGPNPGGDNGDEGGGDDGSQPPGADDGWTGGPGGGSGDDGAAGNGQAGGTSGTDDSPQPAPVPQAAPQAQAGPLANTGYELWPPLLTGVGLLLAGAAALLGSRFTRRRGSVR